MRAIWKFDIGPACSGLRSRFMPRDALIVSVHHQGDTFCLWAQVDPDAEHVRREFWVFATGEQIPIPEARLIYHGTVHAAPYVWHVFERLE